jgi:LmbE family N-acetylglucosaminyl deacetylase
MTARAVFIPAKELLFFAMLAAIGMQAFIWAQTASDVRKEDPYAANNRPPDERFKADILVVVAHPDDEIMAAAYVAREIEAGKRIAIVWTTRGDGGVNAVGPEQSSAMGDIRVVEAMRAAASLGVVNMWNLNGPDTPTQDPLKSLSTCKHGDCLERLIRLVRLTRPPVILTWLPLGVTGENHGDHQASGILATEAFDLAGDSTTFPEQVTPATEPSKNENRLEGLRPWQPQKIYYFSNPSHAEFLDGQGPQYSATDVSPKRHMSYGQIAAEEFIVHRTQGGGRVEQALREHGVEGLQRPIALMKPTRFILGKSLVKSTSVTDDVFAGIVPEGIPYKPAPGYIPTEVAAPLIEFGGPWDYYRRFWPTHGIEHLATLNSPELSVEAGETLAIPLIITNPTSQPIQVRIKTEIPEGWNLLTAPESATVAAKTRYFLRLRAVAPARKIEGWHQFRISATWADGQSLGDLALRVEMDDWALPL